MSGEEVVGGYHERAYAQFDRAFKYRIEINLAARAHNMELQPHRVRGRLRLRV